MIHQKRKESVSSIEEAHLDKLGVSSTDEVNAWYTKAMRDEYKITGIKRVCRLLMENISRPVNLRYVDNLPVIEVDRLQERSL